MVSVGFTNALIPELEHLQTSEANRNRAKDTHPEPRLLAEILHFLFDLLPKTKNTRKSPELDLNVCLFPIKIFVSRKNDKSR